MSALHSLQLRAKTHAVSQAEIDAVLAALSADERVIHWSETGIPLSRLNWYVLSKDINDVIGAWIGRELYVNLDWRLPALQKRLGLAETKLPDADE